MDNSGSPFVPRPEVPTWSGRPLPASMCQPPAHDAEGNLTDRGGYPHPLREQLDALVYQAWQLEAAQPRPPQVQCHSGLPEPAQVVCQSMC